MLIFKVKYTRHRFTPSLLLSSTKAKSAPSCCYYIWPTACHAVQPDRQRYSFATVASQSSSQICGTACSSRSSAGLAVPEIVAADDIYLVSSLLFCVVPARPFSGGGWRHFLATPHLSGESSMRVFAGIPNRVFLQILDKSFFEYRTVMSSLSSHPLPVKVLLLVTAIITIVLGPNKQSQTYWQVASSALPTAWLTLLSMTSTAKQK
jgi:hypothetical protein